MCYIWRPPFGQIANPNPKNQDFRLGVKSERNIVMRWWPPAFQIANPTPKPSDFRLGFKSDAEILSCVGGRRPAKLQIRLRSIEISDSDSNPKRKSGLDSERT